MARKEAYVNTFEKDLSCYKSVVLLTLLKSYLGKIFSTYGRFQEHTCHLAAKHLRLPPLSFLPFPSSIIPAAVACFLSQLRDKN